MEQVGRADRSQNWGEKSSVRNDEHQPRKGVQSGLLGVLGQGWEKVFYSNVGDPQNLLYGCDRIEKALLARERRGGFLRSGLAYGDDVHSGHHKKQKKRKKETGLGRGVEGGHESGRGTRRKGGKLGGARDIQEKAGRESLDDRRMG